MPRGRGQRGSGSVGARRGGRRGRGGERESQPRQRQIRPAATTEELDRIEGFQRQRSEATEVCTIYMASGK